MDKVYILMGSNGSYEDYRSYPIKVYEDKSDAEAEMEKLNKELKEKKKAEDDKYELMEKYQEEHCESNCIRDYECDGCEYNIDIDYSIQEMHLYTIDEIEFIKR